MHAIVHAADLQDRDGGALLMASLFGAFPFLVRRLRAIIDKKVVDHEWRRLDDAALPRRGHFSTAASGEKRRFLPERR